MRDVQLVGENEELFEAEGSVGVDPVVHRGVVGHFVWSGPFPICPGHPMNVPLVVLKSVQTLKDRRLGNKVLALWGNQIK